MQFLQTSEAAARAGVTPDAIRRAARERRLDVSLTTGRGLQLFSVEAVDRYIATREARAAEALERQRRRETA
jgi:hypothetical protein